VAKSLGISPESTNQASLVLTCLLTSLQLSAVSLSDYVELKLFYRGVQHFKVPNNNVFNV